MKHRRSRRRGGRGRVKIKESRGYNEYMKKETERKVVVGHGTRDADSGCQRTEVNAGLQV